MPLWAIEISFVAKVLLYSKLDNFQMMKSFVKNMYEQDFTGILEEEDESDEEIDLLIEKSRDGMQEKDKESVP